jgi:hypothetical protein
MVISRKMQFSTFEPSQFTFEPAGTPAIPEATCNDIGHAISIDIENADSLECFCCYELA